MPGAVAMISEAFMSKLPCSLLTGASRKPCIALSPLDLCGARFGPRQGPIMGPSLGQERHREGPDSAQEVPSARLHWDPVSQCTKLERPPEEKTKCQDPNSRLTKIIKYNSSVPLRAMLGQTAGLLQMHQGGIVAQRKTLLGASHSCLDC